MQVEVDYCTEKLVVDIDIRISQPRNRIFNRVRIPSFISENAAEIGNSEEFEQCHARWLKKMRTDSGSHDYTMNQREAAELGLPVEKPSEEFYMDLKGVYQSNVEQMELNAPFGSTFGVETGETNGNYIQEYPRAHTQI